MSEKKFKINTLRVISIWTLPIVIIFIFLFIFFLAPEKDRDIKPFNIVICSFLLCLIFGAFIFLFFNHLVLVKTTELTFINKELHISQNGSKEKINFSEIEKITEYSTSRLPWSDIMYWRLETHDKEYIISSLTISKFNFDGYFHSKIEHIPKLFPALF